MANFNLVIDTSNFKPFTYKDIMAPFEDYSKEYTTRRNEINQYMDTYGNLQLPQGSKINDEYQKYLQEQNEAMDNFYKYGLNAKTGSALTKAFNMHKGSVRKMQDAVKTYQTMQEQKQQYENQGYIVSGLDDADGKSLDDIYYGKRPKFNAVKQDDIYTRAKDIFTGMNEATLNATKGNIASLVKDQYYIYTQKGLDDKEAREMAFSDIGTIMAKAAQGNNELASAMNQIATSIPSFEKFDNQSRSKIYKTIGLALLSSARNKTDVMNDKTKDLYYQYRADARAQASEEREATKFREDQAHDFGWDDKDNVKEPKDIADDKFITTSGQIVKIDKDIHGSVTAIREPKTNRLIKDTKTIVKELQENGYNVSTLLSPENENNENEEEVRKSLNR